jgi:hypothetical protein
MGFFDRLKGRNQSGDEPPPQVKAIFAKILQFLADEAAQNRAYQGGIGRLICAGTDVDQREGGIGEFGRSEHNPIPVNGPLGELLYISQLVTRTGTHVMGHRLGSMNNVDVYEIASFDGACWDILYFDMYHPRKSRRAPAGFRLEADGFILATNEKVPAFPSGMREAISRCTRDFLRIPLVSSKFQDEAHLDRLRRPPSHAAAVSATNRTIRECTAAWGE